MALAAATRFHGSLGDHTRTQKVTQTRRPITGFGAGLQMTRGEQDGHNKHEQARLA
jgi:hypothetical protein